MPINTLVEEDAGLVTLNLPERFDFSLHKEFVATYKTHEKGKMNYVVDLSRTEYIDSSALGMLLQLRDHCSNRPDGVVLQNGSGAVLEILRTAQFNKLFIIR